MTKRTMPELVGTAEIAKMYGKSSQRAHQLTNEDGFPTGQKLAVGRVWLLDDVLDWFRAEGYFVRRTSTPKAGQAYQAYRIERAD